MNEAQWRAMEGRYEQSPLHQALGMTLVIPGPGQAEVRYDGNPTALNRHGVVAGGSLSAMIDSAVMQACRTVLHPDDRATTIELKVNFIAPAGREKLRTTASLEHVGRRTCVGYARTQTLDGRLVAIGIVSAAVARKRESQQAPVEGTRP